MTAPTTDTTAHAPTLRARVARTAEWTALLAACLTIAWGPLAQGSAFGWGFSGLILLGSVTVALTLIATGLRGRLDLPNPLMTLSALAFLGWVWFSASSAPDRLEGLRWAGIWTAAIGTALSVHALARTRARQQTVLTAFLLTGGAAVTLALLQGQGHLIPGFTYLDGVPEKILTGPYFHPSHYSGYLITVAALTSTVLLNTRPGWHTLPILALAAGAQYTNLFTDGSSIPAVMLAAGVPVIVWAWKHRPWAGVTLSAAALAAAAWVVITLTTPAGQAQFDAYSKQIGINQSFKAFVEIRKAIHRFGTALIETHPTAGIGPGQWATEFQTVRAPVTDHPFRQYADGQYVNYAHSDYLMVTVELGLIGAALLSVTLLVSLIARGLSLLALTGTALVPVYLFTGLYESHLSAIPGTMIGAYVLILGARALQPAPPARPEAPAPVDLSF
ncbi:O-antigen ligase [Deinococcus sp. RIT780]|uniref:O-antigen ligase family protein n=1 Tax=Deinococcus sp. RIT780 TaxID=2870472 RepID=UPI001C8AFD18|nr:O-antigen ligase family protein [Deinococcus sp. RIT780]MBX8465564.1 O-antigen ligase family protein [Deinococcus sp. RIT780]